MLELAYMLGVLLGFFIIIAIAGGLLGLIPFFMARKKGFETMGGVCLIVCVAAPFVEFISDAFRGVLASVPVCLICVLVILIRGKIAGKDKKED